MANVITQRAILQCAHQGIVTLVASQSKLRVGGAPVLVEGDLKGVAIVGCLTVSDPQTSTLQCLTVSSANGGVAAKLKVGGKGVLLEQIQGKTSGTVGGPQNFQTWKVVSAGQGRLRAV